MRAIALLLVFVVGSFATSFAADPRGDVGNNDLAKYFADQVHSLRESSLAEIQTPADWAANKDDWRKHLREMLGLEPLPPRTDLKPVVTGRIDHPELLVEKVHFQSMPGMYVTGNLYLPIDTSKPCPAILYLCGHGRETKNGISYGNKVHYQHHGAWFARHGYVCLVIDSVQLGEIEGLHHGTHNLNQWWWVNRGYSPAGAEAWNCIRALDYLERRKEVDPKRMGATGRSGGGAYSWWIAALDKRIAAAVPVAGITDLENHVVDGCIEGHCDCMYMTNTHRWDYPQVAALVAPRPLLISNTDRDGIFPLEGVVRLHSRVRNVYRTLGASEKLALQITAGGHADTQELHIHAFRWFDQHLMKVNRQIEKPAVPLFTMEQLKVFDKLPSDSINFKIAETFIPAAKSPEPAKTKEEWAKQREMWMSALRQETFFGWPDISPDKIPDVGNIADELRGGAIGKMELKEAWTAERDGVQLAAYDFKSQGHVPLRLYIAQRAKLDNPQLIVVNAIGDDGWKKFLATYRGGFEKELKDEAAAPADAASWESTKKMFASFAWTMAYVSPRGVGSAAWPVDAKKRNQIARRFLLLGQTLDGMQVFDIRRGAQAIRLLKAYRETPLWLQAEDPSMAGVTLYAALFEPKITRVDLYGLPTHHRQGPYLLNVNKYLEMPQVVAMVAEKTKVIVYQPDDSGWDYPAKVAENLGWEKKAFAIRKPPSEK